jgi:hypothetical protein
VIAAALRERILGLEEDLNNVIVLIPLSHRFRIAIAESTSTRPLTP